MLSISSKPYNKLVSLLSIRAGAINPLWSDLNLTLAKAEFLTVLGPNGVGKSTLLASICGNRKLDVGSIDRPARIGYVPQQRMFPPDLPLRSCDLVSLALDHRAPSIRRPSTTIRNHAKVRQLLEHVGASGIAQRRVGTLSGGQQQLIRLAQALAHDPELLLLDEPLLSLDPAIQTKVVTLINQRRIDAGTGIIFVTHSINPVLEHTDKVLYLGPHGHTLGSVAEVMTSENLSALYGAPVEVLRAHGRMVVI